MAFIEAKVLSNLPKEMEVVFLNGKEIEYSYDKENMSRAFYSFKNYKGFPHLMKIENGQMIDQSIHTSFFRCLNGRMELSALLNEIAQFCRRQN